MPSTTTLKHAPAARTVAAGRATPVLPSPSFDLAGKRIHFVGIGGCGMSGLARIAQSLDARCTGSDRSDSDLIARLRAAGVGVVLEQTARSLPDGCDLVVASAAVKEDHPEIIEARRRGVPVYKYAQMLGKLMLGRVGIAVAGTHGKSSTTSILSHVLIECGLDPSFIVGANCKQIGGGSRVSSGKRAQSGGDILVAEACEFDRSFHNLHPTNAVILNVEADHLDMYSGIEEIVESFAVFARRLPPESDGGYLLMQHESPHRIAITAGLECKVETIGFAPQADWCVEVAGFRRQAAGDSGTAAEYQPTVFLRHQGEVVATWRSPLPGEHMAYNSAAAAVLAHRRGARFDAIARAIESFQGLDRRMQRMGELCIAPATSGIALPPVTVVDDYGHHPTEIDTTLRALRHHYNPRRIICVFQPHQHSRTRFLLDEFAASFSNADVVIVPDIYFVRDSINERQAVRSADLVDRLRQRGRQAMHLYPFAAIVEQLQLIAKPGDLVVTMGAGDVWQVARDLLVA